MDAPPAPGPRARLWMAQNGPRLARVGLGLLYLWFGILKFVPGLSAEEDLACRTISALSLGLVPPGLSRPGLALWETLIGACLLTRKFLRPALVLMGLQMLGTAAPLAIFPGETWRRFPISPTVQGQYILKNIVLAAAALIVGASAAWRGDGEVCERVSSGGGRVRRHKL